MCDGDFTSELARVSAFQSTRPKVQMQALSPTFRVQYFCRLSMCHLIVISTTSLPSSTYAKHSPYRSYFSLTSIKYPILLY